ncbi:hypothetical protein D1816_18645 [Aquimarina sp. AD10]|uniref:hypothetical protein n=1 Tax=Aquimarina sp. AD10 TaxID=1714849 RepID=UPI000E4B88B6|nr:hypothetical protein [Aquimarina sp. AD10]AXT62295.1 hypothetical protein D1816_18645 [Aquimarina sp. AD10]RKM90510.1 hypothetical protein D7033_23735 [Aquimarina sp. AD10]
MSKEIKHIWYASYGSNILESRFHCYIRGGQPIGSKKNYKGCSDKTLPKANEEIYINSELYFAKRSKSWNSCGVGFINTKFSDDIQTFGRMYLITSEQYIEIVKQETNHQGELLIDFKKAKEKGSLIFKEKSWYGNLLYLGEQNDNSIFTFTNEKNLIKEINPPSEEYLLTIINGLKETYNLSEIEIKEYFENLPGIKGYEIEKKLTELIKSE